MITDNAVLLRKHIPLPAVNCVQKKGVKKIPTEADYIQANLNGFGDAIGTITNRITTQYDIQARYAVGSDEWDKLEYRIACGQKYQQENIDKIKGISAEPMPVYWYDREAATESDAALNVDIVADRKPYFMSYRYPSERSKYTQFIRAADQSARILFGKSVAELMAQPEHTEEESGFLANYHRRIPMIDNGGTMNRLCHAVERYFEQVPSASSGGSFDYEIMKSGVEYSKHAYNEVRDLYNEYQALVKSLSQRSMKEYWTARRFLDAQEDLTRTFHEELDAVVADPREQCEILLDLCYRSSKGKNFVWDLCAEQIIRNLLQNSGGVYKYIERDPHGDIRYNGERFSAHYKEEMLDEVSDPE